MDLVEGNRDENSEMIKNSVLTSANFSFVLSMRFLHTNKSISQSLIINKKLLSFNLLQYYLI